MEDLLQYAWKYRLYSEVDLCTAEGIRVTVIDAGMQNRDAGPDFFNAKVRLGDTLWAGCVEVHRRSSDWYAHRHDRDAAYDSVILHAVEEIDAEVYRTNGEPVPQVAIRVLPEVREHIEWLLSRDSPSPCLERVGEVAPVHLSAWLSALASERLERKTEAVSRLLERHGNDWNEVFYVSLMRSFGLGANSDAFERLAASLPFQYILKRRNDRTAVEALLFGQAGLLGGENDDPYFRLLQREYLFLQRKHGLQPVDGFLFKKLRMRPVNFPHVRLAQLAAFWCRNDTLFSEMLENCSPKMLGERFEVSVSEYWMTHYHFGKPSPKRPKNIGRSALTIILINTVAPMLFAYGRKKQASEYCARALELLESLPAEQNSLVALFMQAGVAAKNASDTQALIQLRREYCERKKCLYCRIAYHLVRKDAEKSRTGKGGG
jgi:hypothetical protein